MTVLWEVGHWRLELIQVEVDVAAEIRRSSRFADPLPRHPSGAGQFPAPGVCFGAPLVRDIGARSDKQVLMIGKNAVVPDIDRKDPRLIFPQRLDPDSAIVEIDAGFRVKPAEERLLNAPGPGLVTPISPSRTISFRA